ncbi:MAG: hypothetical protein AB7Q27_27965 [Acidimicrobiia bacterium]
MSPHDSLLEAQSVGPFSHESVAARTAYELVANRGERVHVVRLGDGFHVVPELGLAEAAKLGADVGQSIYASGFGFHASPNGGLRRGDRVVAPARRGVPSLMGGGFPDLTFFHELSYPSALQVAIEWASFAAFMGDGGTPTVYLTRPVGDVLVDSSGDLSPSARAVAEQEVLAVVWQGAPMSAHAAHVEVLRYSTDSDHVAAPVTGVASERFEFGARLLTEAGEGPFVDEASAFHVAFSVPGAPAEAVAVVEFGGYFWAIPADLFRALRHVDGPLTGARVRQVVHPSGFGLHGTAVDSLLPGDLVLPASEMGRISPMASPPDLTYYYELSHPESMALAAEWATMAVLMAGRGRPTVYLTEALGTSAVDTAVDVEPAARSCGRQRVIACLWHGEELDGQTIERLRAEITSVA